MAKKYATGFPAASQVNLTDHLQLVQSGIDADATVAQFLATINAALNSVQTIAHSDTPLHLTQPLASVYSIALTNANTVRLPEMNGQNPDWEGHYTVIKNDGNPMTDSPFQIITEDETTVIYPRLEIGQSCILFCTDTSTSNGSFIALPLPNGYIKSRIINGGDIGGDIALDLVLNNVIETSVGSTFTASTIGTNGVNAGLNWWFKNNSTENLTFTPNTNTVNGTASLTLAPNESCWVLATSLEFITIDLSRNSPGGYQSLTFSTAQSLTNPLSTFIVLNPESATAADQHVLLPAANTINSMKIGIPYIFYNTNPGNNAILSNVSDGFLATLPPQQLAFVVLTDNSDAFGTYSIFTLPSTLPLPVSQGGTGATNATTALANLGGVAATLIDALNGIAGLSGYNIQFKNATGTHTSEFTNSATASRTYTFPDASGTVALTTTGTHNTNWAGIWASNQSGNIPYTLNGDVVTLKMPQILATANTASTMANVTALPVNLRPSTNQNGWYTIMNNGANADGKWTINTAGTITITAGQYGNFTGSGNSGTNSQPITYKL